MFLDVFPSLPVRFVSRQEFFWRFGDEPFSRSFFLDGGLRAILPTTPSNHLDCRMAQLVHFSECVARFPFHSGGLGAEGVRNRSQPFATVRNRSQPSANRPREDHMTVPVVSSAEGVIFGGSNVSLLRFAWQAWHFVTFRCVL